MSSDNLNSMAASGEDVAAMAVSKRYEGLLTVRTKAVKGKGAWYWAHLEPILIKNPETNSPNAVKLKCTLCDAAFSSSNPSRTASEHLKSGTCPNFNLMLKPISQLPPLASPSSQQNHRKRGSQHQQGVLQDVYPISMVDSSGSGLKTGFACMPDSCPKQPVFSCRKEDLGPLALLEDSVKRLRSPKASPCPALSNEQVETSFDILADWFYELSGSISFSSLEHPKFKDFLNQLGLPSVSRREFLFARLDSKFEVARRESEARIRDAPFFQLASHGWKSTKSRDNGENCLVNFMVNLPNGTRVFHKTVCSNGSTVPPQYAEEILWETVRGICGNNTNKCAGIVSDKYKAKALANLELQNHWMVNVSCLLQGFFSLIKDLHRELPLFRNVTESCLKVANLVNSMPQVRSSLHKFRLQRYEFPWFIRVPSSRYDIGKNFSLFIFMLKDILSCSRILHLVVLEDSFRVVYLEDFTAREVADIIRDVGFWHDVEAARALVKLIVGMSEEIESERPLLGQCLPLWEELREKVMYWCTKHNFPKEPVEKILERRFKRTYHPAWSAAFILDPLYLARNSSGKYLPCFKFLTPEQEKDVDELITRLVPREEIHIALMELMKWRAEGLDPLYAQAVQVKQPDRATGKMKIANPSSSRLVWETCLKEFESLSKVAVRLLFLHATSSGIKGDFSFERLFCEREEARLGLQRAQKFVFVAANSRLERRDFPGSEERILSFSAVGRRK
ncbi:uncharacterized protein LOC142504290 [Primulina tabacum]|uniref:uncharacterized protein LOC142504290 n=1 Tax=Primulina tabacum TaxID=48773 RepID=UPI003F5A3106